jgi:Peptidase family M23
VAALRRLVVFAAAGLAALGQSALAHAYGWPLKPFDQPHAIRGAFGDPRSGTSFHFGVDISAPDGTPVYAVAPGTVFRYSDAVAVRQADGHEFSYWHVEATVPEHSSVRAGDEIGVTRPRWGHVHFAEWDGTDYLNPLRPGALEPFIDTTTPVVGPISVRRVAGAIDATVEAYDTPPIAPPPPWQDARWAPALVRWRILQDGHEVIPWVDAADFRTTRPPPSEFSSVYAPGTEQNWPDHAGRYVFWLAHGLQLANGSYQLEVEAEDTRGNVGTASLSFVMDAVSVPRSIRIE